MSTDDLNTFIVLYENKNFIDTAFELNISQSTLSKKIKKIEIELNVPLISSTSNERGSKVTPSGELFYQFAIRSINAVRKFKDKVEKMYELENGGVNIAYTNDALNPMVVNKLNQIMTKLPKTNFHFKQVNYQQLENIMFKNEADIILANNIDLFKNKFDFYELCQTQLGIFANSKVDLNNERTVITSLEDKYLNGFDQYKHQLFPSFDLLMDYLKFNPKAAMVLPISFVNNRTPLIKKLPDSSVKTFLVTPNNHDTRPVIKYINEHDKRPVIKYIINEFTNENN